ncbi:hypothetical protein PanWU01x14_265620, partial [Parasponia andersonii]
MSITRKRLSLLVDSIPGLINALMTIASHLSLPLTSLSKTVNEETWSITDSMDRFERIRSALEMTLQMCTYH